MDRFGADSRTFFGETPTIVNSLFLNALKITSMRGVLYGFCTINEAEITHNSFAERTLGLRLQWNEDFTEDPPSVSLCGRGRWPQVRTSPQGDGGNPLRYGPATSLTDWTGALPGTIASQAAPDGSTRMLRNPRTGSSRPLPRPTARSEPPAVKPHGSQ